MTLHQMMNYFLSSETAVLLILLSFNGDLNICFQCTFSYVKKLEHYVFHMQYPRGIFTTQKIRTSKDLNFILDSIRNFVLNVVLFKHKHF